MLDRLAGQRNAVNVVAKRRKVVARHKRFHINRLGARNDLCGTMNGRNFFVVLSLPFRYHTKATFRFLYHRPETVSGTVRPSAYPFCARSLQTMQDEPVFSCAEKNSVTRGGRFDATVNYSFGLVRDVFHHGRQLIEPARFLFLIGNIFGAFLLLNSFFAFALLFFLLLLHPRQQVQTRWAWRRSIALELSLTKERNKDNCLKTKP